MKMVGLKEKLLAKRKKNMGIDTSQGFEQALRVATTSSGCLSCDGVKAKLLAEEIVSNQGIGAMDNVDRLELAWELQKYGEMDLARQFCPTIDSMNAKEYALEVGQVSDATMYVLP